MQNNAYVSLSTFVENKGKATVPKLQCVSCDPTSPSQANKIIEHRRKYERKRDEQEIRARQERVKKVKEEHERAQKVRNLLICIKLLNQNCLHSQSC